AGEHPHRVLHLGNETLRRRLASPGDTGVVKTSNRAGCAPAATVLAKRSNADNSVGAQSGSIGDLLSACLTATGWNSLCGSAYQLGRHIGCNFARDFYACSCKWSPK